MMTFRFAKTFLSLRASSFALAAGLLPLACSTASPEEPVGTSAAADSVGIWASYGMPATTQIAAARGVDGKLVAFGLGAADGSIPIDAQAVVNGGWSGPSSLGGHGLRQFAVGHNADGRLEVLAIGGDGALYHVWQTGTSGAWGTWAYLGGTQLQQVAVANEHDGRLRAFVLGGDGNVYTIAQTSPNGGWGTYAFVGGAPLQQIAAGTDPAGTIEIVGLSTSGATMVTQESAANSSWWPAFSSLAGWATKLAVGQNADGRIEIYQLGSGGTVYHQWRTPAGAWSGWASLGATAGSTDLAVGNEANGSLDVFIVGPGGGIYENTQNGPNGGWGTMWATRAAGPFQRVAVASNADGHLELLGLTTSGDLQHTWETALNGTWAGAPPPPMCTGMAQPPYAVWTVPGPQDIYFQQLSPGESPNNFSNCFSGCGPTAWAMFYAEIDARWRPLAATGAAPWWTSQPDWFRTTVNMSSISWSSSSSPNYPQITIDVSHWMGTSCGQPFTDQAYTEPSWMIHGYDYLTQGAQAQYSPHGPTGPLTTGDFTYTYETHGTGDSLVPDYNDDYGTLGYARDWIINHRYPVVYGYMVGSNVITNAHYGVATAYREKATGWTCADVGGAPQWVVTQSDNTSWQFYINAGGADTNDWRNPPAFYVGTIKIDRK